MQNKPQFIDYMASITNIDSESRIFLTILDGDLADTELNGFRSIYDRRPSPDYIGFPEILLVGDAITCPSRQVVRLHTDTIDAIIDGQSALIGD